MKIYFISIILLYVTVSSKAANVSNLDVWNQYSAVYGDKVIHNVYHDADTLNNSLAFEKTFHPSNVALPSYTIACSNYSVGATISLEARNRLDLKLLKPTIVDKLGNLMCFNVKKETPDRYTRHMHFLSQVPPTLKVESSLYKFIEKLMANKTLSMDENSLTSMSVVFEMDTDAAEMSVPTDIEEAIFSLRGYNFDSLHTFYWSSSAYAGFVKLKNNSTTPSPYSNTDRTAWISINQTLDAEANSATSTFSVSDPCKFLKLTHKNGIGKVVIDISITAAVSSSMKGVCLAFMTANLAQNPRVRLISLTSSPVVLNYHSRSIQESGNVGASSTASPYSAAGLLGDGQIIGIADTGVDESSCYFSDTQNGYVSRSTLSNPTFDLKYRKIIQYVVAEGGDASDEYSGHGTHTCGTALGSISGGDLWTVGMYDGVAPNAKLAFVDCGVSGGGLSIPSTAEALYGPSYIAGSRIHSNSWGSSFSGSGYYANNDVDQYLYDHTDSVIFFAAGNSGMIGYNTISIEAAAKNVIAVGSSESTLDSTDINYIAYYSSKGPTYDGRIKPDILAPGHTIMSVLSNGGDGPSCGTTQKSGTSMASPGAAGIAGIVRQYFSDPQFWATMCNPIYSACKAMSASGVLVKAILLHSGTGMTLYDGTSGAIPLASTPDILQGYGRITLSNVLPLRDIYSFNLFVEDLTTIQENTQITYAWTVYSSTMPMKVTIAWYDPPNTDGTTNAALIHNLDLKVVSPSGYTFFGNQQNQNWVIPDSVNTNEQVNVESPESGNWQIFVISNALPYAGYQKFSVVITSN